MGNCATKPAGAPPKRNSAASLAGGGDVTFAHSPTVRIEQYATRGAAYEESSSSDDEGASLRKVVTDLDFTPTKSRTTDVGDPDLFTATRSRSMTTPRLGEQMPSSAPPTTATAAAEATVSRSLKSSLQAFDDAMANHDTRRRKKAFLQVRRNSALPDASTDHSRPPHDPNPPLPRRAASCACRLASCAMPMAPSWCAHVLSANRTAAFLFPRDSIVRAARCVRSP